MEKIIIRTEAHPFNPGAKVYRAYQLFDDGELFPLYVGGETVDECKGRVSRFNQNPRSFQVVTSFKEITR
jgi:hypothetical protein